jgi:hypothetical protein
LGESLCIAFPLGAQLKLADGTIMLARFSLELFCGLSGLMLCCHLPCWALLLQPAVLQLFDCLDANQQKWTVLV